MNIWTLNKHKNIKVLLIKMQMHMGRENICLADAGTGINSESSEETHDYLSVVLVHPNQPEVRAYISAYKDTDDLYDIHLEYPWFIENKKVNDLLVYDELNAQQIINTLATHFNVSGFRMAM
jgi:hypothetical protein